MTLLIVGGLSIDHVTTAEGTTHVGLCGGNAIYAAVGARLWLEDIAVVGAVGADYPPAWVEELSAHGIDTSGVLRVATLHPLIFSVRYGADGERVPYVPVDALEAAGASIPDRLRSRGEAMLELVDVDSIRVRPDQVPDHLRSPEALLLVPSPRDWQPGWVAAFRPRTKTVLVDPEEEGPSELSPRDLADAFSDVDVALPSLRQLGGLSCPGPREAAKAIAGFGPSVVVVKLGARGSFVYDARTANGFLVPAYPSTVVDATGAGDAYCGGFMAGLHLSGDPATAALYAAVSASFAIEAHGALAGLHAARTAALGRVDWLRGQGHEWNGRPQDAAAQPEVNPDAVSLRDGGCSGNSGHHSRAGITEVNSD
jgi:sugar/nucleoside kinase (ribokinase family)